MKDRSIMLRATQKREGLYEVKGVMFKAKSELEAIRKYLRKKELR